MKRKTLTQKEKQEFKKWLKTEPEIDLNLGYICHWKIHVQNDEDYKPLNVIKEELLNERPNIHRIPKKIVRTDTGWQAINKHGKTITEKDNMGEVKNSLGVDNVLKLKPGEYEVLDIFEQPDNISHASRIEYDDDTFCYTIYTDEGDVVARFRTMKYLKNNLDLDIQRKDGEYVIV